MLDIFFVADKFIVTVFLRSNRCARGSTNYIGSIQSWTKIQDLVCYNGYHFIDFHFYYVYFDPEALYEDSSIYEITETSDRSNCNGTDEFCLDIDFFVFSVYRKVRLFKNVF
jgi:hypothetical protein